MGRYGRNGSLAQAVIALLRQHQGEHLSPRSVADLIPDSKYYSICQTLFRLYHKGVINSPHRGVYAAWPEEAVTTEPETLRRFRGYRPMPPQEYIDKSITNAGMEPDYEGVLFSDGTVCIRWLTQYRSHSIWTDWEAFFKVHGHPEYGTRIEWLDAK